MQETQEQRIQTLEKQVADLKAIVNSKLTQEKVTFGQRVMATHALAVQSTDGSIAENSDHAHLEIVLHPRVEDDQDHRTGFQIRVDRRGSETDLMLHGLSPAGTLEEATHGDQTTRTAIHATIRPDGTVRRVELRAGISSFIIRDGEWPEVRVGSREFRVKP